MKEGKRYDFVLPDGNVVPVSYSSQTPSSLFKVNQVGYSTAAGRRFAYLGQWLGPLGAYPVQSGCRFDLVDAQTDRSVLQGVAVKRIADVEKKGTPFTGEETLEMDLTKARAGRYYLRIAGIGRSADFLISDDSVGVAYSLHLQGLFQQRCGCAKTSDLTPWADEACHLRVKRGISPPDEWEFASQFTDETGKPVKVKHFAVNTAMMLTYTEELSLPGGWHDAADYDRRPMHLQISGNLAMLYLLKPEHFTDGQLLIPERENGIPDLLDEAVWGLRHLIAGQQRDGGVGTWIETTRHPGEGDHVMPSRDPLIYALSRATKRSSMDYASIASLVARALLRTGNQTNKMALFTVSDTYFNDSLTSSTDKIALPPMTVLASDCTLSGLHFRMGGASLRRRK